MSEIIRVEHLYKRFKRPDTPVKEVLSDLSFSVEEGEILGIMGSSGRGKTTLLKILGLMDDFSDGDILFREESFDGMSESEKSRMRREKIGFIFQDYMLLDSLTVEDNICLPLLIAHSENDKAYEEVRRLGETLGISEIMDRYPKTLSGGEKQRVAICRAMINNPDLILADEPTGNLDEKNREKVIQEIVKLSKDFRKTVIIVTHDSYVATFCDRVLHLDTGEVL